MLRNLALLSLLLTLPMPAAAQGAPGGMPPAGQMGMPAMPPEVQAKFEELRTLTERLKGVRDQAAKSPRISKQMESFRTDVENQMIKQHPELKPKVVRFRTLEKELEPLIAANDFQKAQPLLMELRGLAEELTGAQQKALAAPSLAKRGESLQTSIKAEMERIEPKMPKLLQRAEVLRLELQQMMMAPPPGATGGPRAPGPRAPGGHSGH